MVRFLKAFLCFILFFIVIVQLQGSVHARRRRVFTFHPNTPVSHYLEINCKSYRYRGKVVAYNCPFMKKENSHSTKCLYKGKLIENEERVSHNDCAVRYCVCKAGATESTRGRIDCPVANCKESLSANRRLQRNCIHQYTLDNCCITADICDQAAIAALATCSVNSTVYREGERFFPQGSCKKCICTKDFAGDFNGPSCKSINCGLELSNQDLIFSKCAPIYKKDQSCCPIGWQCDTTGNTIQQHYLNVPYKNKYKCHIGNQTLNIGDQMKVKGSCITCSCDYPPLLTCIENTNCAGK